MKTINETKHTPGPWRIAPRSTALHGLDIMCGPYRIATLGNSNPHGEEDAKLIAAAPDLLEALRQIDAICAKNYKAGYAGPESALMLICRNAIAKATGEQS